MRIVQAIIEIDVVYSTSCPEAPQILTYPSPSIVGHMQEAHNIYPSCGFPTLLKSHTVLAPRAGN